MGLAGDPQRQRQDDIDHLRPSQADGSRTELHLSAVFINIIETPCHLQQGKRFCHRAVPEADDFRLLRAAAFCKISTLNSLPVNMP
jgi:hypothetical protein